MHGNNVAVALIAVLVICLIAYFAYSAWEERARDPPGAAKRAGSDMGSDVPDNLLYQNPYATQGGDRIVKDDPPQPHQRKSVYDTESRFYSTADVDPLIVGQAYAFRDYTRDVYEGRSALGGAWGLQEFNVDSTPGAVGTDVGPNSLSEYEGSILGYNEGIPEQWAFPSTPMRQYIPQREDYTGLYGPEVANGSRLYAPWVPDHEPEIGEEEEPYPPQKTTLTI